MDGNEILEQGLSADEILEREDWQFLWTHEGDGTQKQVY